MNNDNDKDNDNILLGDMVAKILHWGPIGWIVHKITGLDKPCDECEQRRKDWNKLLRKKKMKIFAIKVLKVIAYIAVVLVLQYFVSKYLYI
jgi:hypothetical protein